MQNMQEVPFYYLSARAYAKQTGIGEAEVKKQLIKGELEGFTTDNQYKVKVYRDGNVSYKQYETVLKRAIEAEAKLEQAKSILV
jgi:hypothetical protein|nr:MAG TPA: hypothetical protein [Caudoviricetes sp.]